MAIGITGKFKPDGNFPLIDAVDVEMPDGTRLSEYEFTEDTETEVVLLEEENVPGFALDNTFGYALRIPQSPITLAIGETYKVMWDETPWTVTAFDGSNALPGVVCIGNGGRFNLPGNGEPFIIGIIGGAMLVSAFADPAASHKIGIYQTVKKPVLPPVTAADNGKILQVVNGEWMAKEAFIPMSQEEYDALVASGSVDESKYYMIVG